MSYTNVNKDTINTPVHRWNYSQVQFWLTENRMANFIDKFEENNVDGRCLLELTDRILEDVFLIKSKDERLKILSAKNRLAKGIFSIDDKTEKIILYKEKQHTLNRKHSNEDNKLTVPKVNTNFNVREQHTLNRKYSNEDNKLTVPKLNTNFNVREIIFNNKKEYY